MRLYIKTPATTANMGPGFDCIGMALQLYNEIWIEDLGEKAQETLIIQSKNDPKHKIPRDGQNLIYQSFRRLYNEMGLVKLPKLKILQEDYIPMTRGLGSSAASVVAGLLAANTMSKAELSREELAFMASKIEGHPDNVAPALFGGMVVSVVTEKKLESVKISEGSLNRLAFAVMIPGFHLATVKARKVLPDQYGRADMVFNTSRSALMVGALMQNDFEKLAIAMEDRIHQPYRLSIIPNMDDIFRYARAMGAKGVFLSGAGPTLIAVLEKDQKGVGYQFKAGMEQFLRTLPDQWDVKILEPDFKGAQVYIR